MQNSWLSHTTEKLYLAELQIKSCQAFGEEERAANNNMEASFRQSAIMLISLAWESYLNELAEYYQKKTGVIASLHELEALLGPDSPEVAYLNVISKEQGSWLAEINQLNRLLRRPTIKKQGSASSDSSSGLIIAVSEKGSDIDSLENIRYLLSEFKNYIKDCRSRMSEW